MNDDVLVTVMSSWLKGTAAVAPDPVRSAKSVMARLPEPTQGHRRWSFPIVLRWTGRSTGTRDSSLLLPSAMPGGLQRPANRRRATSMSSAAKVMLVSVLTLLVGGLVVTNGPSNPAPQAPAAVTSDATTPTPGPTSTTLASEAPTETAMPQWTTAPVVPDPDKLIAWPAPSVTFEADKLRIRVRGKTFVGGDPEWVDSSAPSVDRRTFDVLWQENGVDMRMDIEFSADGDHFWIDAFRVYDGAKAGKWVEWRGPLYSTPLGAPMEADVRLEGGDGRVKATIDIEGMRITAFHPGSGPGPLTGCEPPVLPDSAAARPVLMIASLSLAAPGLSDAKLRARLADWDEPEHQFKGSGLWTMSPSEVESFLRATGVCFDFTYMYTTQRRDGSASTAEGERWCTAPPGGRVAWLRYSADAVNVGIRDDTLLPVREAPPQGWNCPTN